MSLSFRDLDFCCKRGTSLFRFSSLFKGLSDSFDPSTTVGSWEQPDVTVRHSFRFAL